MKVWALLSVGNNSPDTNLEAWWIKKPLVKQILEITGLHSEARVTVSSLMGGYKTRIGDKNYTLMEIEEGVVKSVRVIG